MITLIAHFILCCRLIHFSIEHFSKVLLVQLRSLSIQSQQKPVALFSLPCFKKTFTWPLLTCVANQLFLLTAWRFLPSAQLVDGRLAMEVAPPTPQAFRQEEDSLVQQRIKARSVQKCRHFLLQSFCVTWQQACFHCFLFLWLWCFQLQFLILQCSIHGKGENVAVRSLYANESVQISSLKKCIQAV